MWVLLPGALAGGRTWAVAVCYFRPPSQPAPAAEEEAAGWFARLAADWVAAAEAGWVPTVAGDLNARTAAAPDWPAWESGVPRRTQTLCLTHAAGIMGACIVNGRVPGDAEGAVTSVGVSRTGRAVVDYFILPATHLPQVRELRVSEDAVVCDHSSLVLAVEAVGAAPLPQRDQALTPARSASSPL
jgi:hypothetical protein